MIIGQILVNDLPFSTHRFPESRLNEQGVKRVLAELARDEQLGQMGKVEIRVHSQRGLERLMSVILGLDPARR